MCMSSPKPQPAPVVTPPPAPPPPEPTPEAPVLEEGGRRSATASRDSRRRGVSALRISLSVPQPDGGQGVNVPQ